MFWYLFWRESREIWRAENRNLGVYTEKRKGTSLEAPFFVYFIYHGDWYIYAFFVILRYSQQVVDLVSRGDYTVL